MCLEFVNYHILMKSTKVYQTENAQTSTTKLHSDKKKMKHTGVNYRPANVKQSVRVLMLFHGYLPTFPASILEALLNMHTAYNYVRTWSYLILNP